ncbi:peptidylprolyl isomerase [Maribacter arenosus]|uniref:Peptidyl-prolyl cis-trans isomerase n=1 Tax=Maribacter arenosus TaxID=1854708 RepID=A0ABR7VDY0_9FLAO|nr:peptidylprolyl isomerase [Maribacter arenosus]MBD0850528.1 peptidylprolyl isomerase [Maribacter arenosus]
MSKLLFPLLFVLSTCARQNYEVAQIKTPQGEILIWLYEETPNHKQSFLQLAKEGYWDSLTFNRVIPDFVAQGGCPDTPEGFTDPEYLLKPEFNDDLVHDYGAVGAGRDNNPDKLSARCQFYIVQHKEGVHRLDGDYTIFGKVIKGMEVVDAIVNSPRDSMDAPLTPIPMDIDIVRMNAAELQEYAVIK